ncbi:MAG: DUF2147 domain-containing protein [Silicimonas sp.]|nr:DUF2147 domain-containing protein [Silicimonas sp.]NNL74458.1 DUF2147 domain-containing protein [Silicimonas sp.]
MIRAFKTAIFASFLATPAFADPVLGTYQTQPGDTGSYAHVELYDCDGSICGVIRKAFDSAGKEVASDTVGKRMIWGMAAKGEGSYSGGKIWAPDRDKTYTSKMQLSGKTLKVSGCVAVICRAQTWTRIR